MPTVRQQIVDALVAQLQTITMGNGYATDIMDRVYADRDLERRPLAVTDLPCLTVADGKADIAVDVYPRHSHRLTVDIAGFVSDKATPGQAREMAQDILTAIGSNDTLGGLCIEIIPHGHEIGRVTFGDVVGAVMISCTVHYRTELWKI